MRVAVFSAQSYDRRFLNEANAQEDVPGRFDLNYQDAALSAGTADLPKACDAVCLFVNDQADAGVLEALAAAGVRPASRPANFLSCGGNRGTARFRQ
jgi:D-lactate dehydrogenase